MSGRRDTGGDGREGPRRAGRSEGRAGQARGTGAGRRDGARRADSSGSSAGGRGSGGGRGRATQGEGRSASPGRGAASFKPRRDAGAPDRGRSGAGPRRAERSPSPEVRSRSTATAGVPAPPEDVDVSLLERSVRAELRSLSKLNADAVGRYLVAAGQVIDVDPQRALSYARAARGRAARVAAVREAVGIAAYHAGEWAEALTELRTARRISGDPRNLAVIADAERALGRPEQAARALADPDVRRLDGEARTELLIVVAGARRDLGQLDAALAVLARGGLDEERPRPGAARLWYAYGDALEAAGRRQEAARWFAASAARDPEGELDAAERAAALL